ncbi:hypothetical protein BGS_0216 [Beggiatoa sp. SS]|nr:hypothetical protein BGS_0216 [Beggiatoa sp. SS]
MKTPKQNKLNLNNWDCFLRFRRNRFKNSIENPLGQVQKRF